MKVLKIICLSFLIIACGSRGVMLDANNFKSEEKNESEGNCAKFVYENKNIPLFYKNTKKETPEFLFNPSKVYESLYPSDCKGLNREKVVIIKSEWRTFPGGLGDQKEVVYMEVLIGKNSHQFQAESDIYWFISGSREEAIRQAVTRVFKSIQRINK